MFYIIPGIESCILVGSRSIYNLMILRIFVVPYFQIQLPNEIEWVEISSTRKKNDRSLGRSRFWIVVHAQNKLLHLFKPQITLNTLNVSITFANLWPWLVKWFSFCPIKSLGLSWFSDKIILPTVKAQFKSLFDMVSDRTD